MTKFSYSRPHQINSNIQNLTFAGMKHDVQTQHTFIKPIKQGRITYHSRSPKTRSSATSSKNQEQSKVVIKAFATIDNKVWSTLVTKQHLLCDLRPACKERECFVPIRTWGAKEREAVKPLTIGGSWEDKARIIFTRCASCLADCLTQLCTGKCATVWNLRPTMKFSDDVG